MRSEIGQVCTLVPSGNPNLAEKLRGPHAVFRARSSYNRSYASLPAAPVVLFLCRIRTFRRRPGIRSCRSKGGRACEARASYLTHQPGAEPRARRQAMGSSRPAGEPVCPLRSDRRLPARGHQSAASGVVYARGDVESPGAGRGRVCHRSSGSAAGAALSGSGDRRGFQHAAGGRSRAAIHASAR